MSASASDKLMKVGSPGTATTLSSPGYTSGVSTSINVASTTNWPTDTGVIFAIDEATTNAAGEEVRVDGTYNEFEGTVASATQITNVDYKAGDAERSYSAGSTTRVYIPVSSERENRIVTWGTTEHNQDGTHDEALINSRTLITSTQTTDHVLVADDSDSDTLKKVALDNLLADGSVTPDKLLASTGTSWVWQDWTPTLTNLSGGTLNYAKYVQIGKTVITRFKYTLAGAGVSGTPIISLPTAANAGYTESNEPFLGDCSLFDTGTAFYKGQVRFVTSSSVNLSALNASGTYLTSTGVSSTIPHTWAATDVLTFYMIYEAA